MARLYKRKGGEILVNIETFATQQSASISLLPGGGFVVVWMDGSALGTDTSSFGIKAQLFDASGERVGGEFLVNTTVTGSQAIPAVTTLASGRFVVTWTDASATGGDTSSNAVRGQFFEANGTPVGAEFLVNTQTANSQTSPAITELSGGGFVVSWTDSSLIGGDNNGSGIKAQIFDAAGAKVGGEILVNTEIAGSQVGPNLIAFGTGFAAVWQGATTFPGGNASSSIRLQLFDAAGAKLGIEQVVNANNDGSFGNANITALASGFIVTWSQQDALPIPGVATTSDIRAQRYDANGAKLGAEFVVNTITSGSQSAADVDLLPGGFFLVTWQGSTVGTVEFNIYGQVFDANGVKVGTEFIVNSTTDGSQIGARVDVLPSGDIVILWQDNSGDQDELGSGIKMQILTLATDAPTDITLSQTLISETAREDTPLITLGTTGAVNSTFTYEIVSDSTGGAFAILGDRLVVIDNSLLDFETATQVEIRIRTTDLNGQSFEETIQLDIGDTPESTYGPAGAEFLVNTTTAQNQSEPFLTPLTTGGFLATWLEWPLMGGDTVTRGQLYDEHGEPVGGELTLGDAATATGLPGGGFVTATVAPDAAGDGIFLQFYNNSGTAIGAPIQANTITTGNQLQPALTALALGGFVATWSDAGATIPTVRGQLFNAEGTKVGTEFIVPAIGGGVPDVAALAGGGFVVAWQDDGIQAQIFTASGLRHGPQLAVAAFSSTDTHVAALADGGFVVVWSGRVDIDGDVDHFAVGAQVYDAHGNKVGGQVLVHDDTPDHVYSLDVAALAWGGFVVTWAAEDVGPPSDSGIRAQIFDGTGTPLGDQLVVADGADLQIHADVIALPSGEIVIAWSDFDPTSDGEGASVKARLFSLGGPTAGPDTLNGTAAPDTIDGLGGDDVINGLGGDDMLTGGAGDDELNGGEGDDTFFVSQGHDLVAGDNGIDTLVIDYSGSSGQLFITTLSPVPGDSVSGGYQLLGDSNASVAFTSIERFVIIATAQADQIIASGMEDVVDGGGGDDYIQTGHGDDTLRGGDGSEALNSLDGDDLLDGGSGVDEMVGGAGDDTYFVDHANDLVGEYDDEGDDVVFASTSYALDDFQEVERLTAADLNDATAMNLTGNQYGQTITGNAGANLLEGREGADILIGAKGDDFLDGGTGVDRMTGGSENDTYIVDHGSDEVVEVAGGGTRDVIYARVSYTMAAGIQAEVLSVVSQSGGNAIDLTGNAFYQELYGNTDANFLDGGAGADSMQGFAGNDTYIVDHSGDAVIEGAGEGTRDVIYARTHYTMAAGLDVEVLSVISQSGGVAIDLTGNSFYQELYGNTDANFLDGGAGADSMQGFGGNDTYIVDHAGDAVIEGAGEGTRDVIYARTHYTMAAGLDVEVLSVISQAGGVAIDLTGNALFQELYGNTDANFLDGGAGADYLQGFGGNDSYIVDVQADTIIEGAAEGNRDVLYARASYALGTGVGIEVMATISGGATTAIDLTGNELANEMYGNAGANVLNGLGGADYLQGSGGADTFAFTTALGAGNVDTVADFLSGTDRIRLDDAIFTQIGAAGALNANAFVTGTAAADGNDRIVYNNATGQLFYDADGTGGTAAVLFATLTGNPALAASDFQVI